MNDLPVQLGLKVFAWLLFLAPGQAAWAFWPVSSGSVEWRDSGTSLPGARVVPVLTPCTVWPFLFAHFRSEPGG